MLSISSGPGSCSEGRIAQLAEQQGREPARLIEDLKGTEALSGIEDDIWLEKVHDLIVSMSKVATESVEPPKVAGSAEAQGDEGRPGA